MRAARYLAVMLGATAAVTAVLSLALWQRDPLRFAEPAAAAVTQARDPVRGGFARAVFAVTAAKPATVILGTSRAASGFDPAHPSLTGPDGPAFNLALAGVSIAQIGALLEHAHRVRPVRRAIIGLDLEAFLAGGRADFDPALLATAGPAVPAWLHRLRLNLSWDALGAAFERDGVAPRPSSDGGQRRMVRITETNNAVGRLPQLFPGGAHARHWEADPRRADALRAFARLLAFARAEGIALQLFVSPVHARYLEVYRQSGWWPLFEAWKRAVAQAVADEAARSPGRAPFLLVDFATHDARTTEALPVAGDTRTAMRWYIETSHYSPAHGAVILDCLAAAVSPALAEPCGTPLVAGAALEAHLAAARRGLDDYRRTHPQDVAEIDGMFRILRRLVRRPMPPVPDA